MLNGIFPVIPTLFNDDDSIAPDEMKKVVAFALDAGAHGVVFPGVASEYNFLTVAERGELMTMVHDEVAGRVPIIGGASAPTSEEVIVAGKQCQQHGINILMIMAQGCLGKDVTAHQAFFQQVTESLPGVEVMLQNAPVPVGAGLNAESIATIVVGNPAIAYAKEETLPSGPAITNLQSIDVPHLNGVFGGGGARYLIDELNRGAIGAIPAVELTDLHVAIFDCHSKGDAKRARELYQASLPLLLCQLIYRMRLTKYVLSKRGVSNLLKVRAPLPELDRAARQDVDQMLADLKENCRSVMTAP